MQIILKAQLMTTAQAALPMLNQSNISYPMYTLCLTTANLETSPTTKLAKRTPNFKPYLKLTFCNLAKISYFSLGCSLCFFLVCFFVFCILALPRILFLLKSLVSLHNKDFFFFSCFFLLLLLIFACKMFNKTSSKLIKSLR